MSARSTHGRTPVATDRSGASEDGALTDLTSDALALRLEQLAGEERAVLAEFIVHLEEFDRRRSYLDAGHGSLWDWCLKVLHLREGAAGRRIGAMRMIRRFPKLIDTIRDGRLCLSTAVLLGQALTDDNLDDLVARAAYKTKAEVDHLVASLRPREAPRDGIRRLPSPAPASTPAPSTPTALTVTLVQTATPDAALFARTEAGGPSTTATVGAAAPLGTSHGNARSCAEIRPVGRDEWSLRVTIDGACKADLEMLQHLLSHTCGRDLASALREAIRCGIEKHGKRRGAVPTKHRRAQPSPARRAQASADEISSASPDDTERRTVGAPPAAADLARSTDSRRDHIPAAVKQAVYERDGGCCSFVAADGRRCGSKWKLEFDHAHSAFLGGPTTLENVRLRCRAHNVLHAEQVFGREHMDRFRAGARVPRAGPG